MEKPEFYADDLHHIVESLVASNQTNTLDQAGRDAGFEQAAQDAVEILSIW